MKKLVHLEDQSSLALGRQFCTWIITLSHNTIFTHGISHPPTNLSKNVLIDD